MMKKALFIVIAATLLTGCMTIHKDVTNDPKFKSVVAKVYQTNDDFVLIQLHKGVELMAEEFGQQGVPTREEVAKNNMPFNYYGDTIHGILLKGTQFKVIKVTYMNNFETRQIYYTAEILSAGPFEGKSIDVSLLTDGSEVPKLLEKFAIEVK
jgi:hypothetical protein